MLGFAPGAGEVLRIMKSRTRQLASVVAMMGVAAAPASAQSDSTVRFDEAWRPLLGCWANAGNAASPASFCVVPTHDRQTVDVVSLLGDSIVSRAPLTATGARIARTEEGCSGFERGTWSADTHRLFTHAEYTCAGGQKVSSDGMYMLLTPSRFARIEAVPAAGGSNVRVRTYELRADASKLPLSLASLLPSPNAAVVARAAAAADVTPAAVIEAATLVEDPVVDTWLAMRGQLFGLSSADTRALRRAHVPEGTITAMVSGYRRQPQPTAPKPADHVALNDAQVVMGSGLNTGSSSLAFNDYVPYWLYKMGVGSSYDSYRANAPCFGAAGCDGLFNPSTGEFYVKHRPIQAPVSAPQSATDSPAMSTPSMSVPNASAPSATASPISPTITGKP
jgi:hypothetical protein